MHKKCVICLEPYPRCTTQLQKSLVHAGSILHNPDELWSPLHCQCFAPRTVAAVPQLDEQRLALSYAV